MIQNPSQQLHKSQLRLEIIQDVEAWDALANEWRQLVKTTHQNTPFLTYEFQRAWWEHRGGGEWPQATLNILVARREDGSLLGIAPLFASPEGSLHFIGSHEIADFLDLIARAEDLPTLIEAVLDYLAESNWKRLDLYNLLDSSQTQGALQSAAEARGWLFRLETLQPSPYLVIPGSLDAYTALLGSKQGHELRRKLRRAERNPEPVTLEIVEDADQLPHCLEDFFALMVQEEDKARFLTPAMQTQMEAIAQAACKAGWLQIPFLKVGNDRVAGYMNFDYDGRIWAYNSGFKNGHADLSPGWLLMAHQVQWCIDNGRSAFDFMRGGEEYKYRFGAVDRFVQRATVTRP